MPFENTLAIMEPTGAQVLSLLKHNFKGGVSRLQVSSELSISININEQGQFEADSMQVLYNKVQSKQTTLTR